MRAMLTIARGIRRMLAALGRPAPADPGSEIVEEFTLHIPGGGVVRFEGADAYHAAEQAHSTEIGEHDPLADAMREFHLAVFRKTFSRYSRAELAEIGADVATIPDAADAVADHFAGWEVDRATRSAQAITARAQRSDIALTVTNLTAHAAALAPQILHRASRRELRPLILTQCH